MKKKKLAEKTLTATLATSMVMSMVPYNVFASERGVSIYVKDQNGKAIQGATVDYTIEGESTVSAVTNENGVVDIIPIELYQGDTTVVYNVICENYEGVSDQRGTINSSTQDFNVVLNEIVVPVFEITAKENLKYTGNPLDLVDVNFKNLDGDITYLVTDKKAEDGTPDFTDVKEENWTKDTKIQATEAGTYYLKFKNNEREENVVVSIAKYDELEETKNYDMQLSTIDKDNKVTIQLENALDGKKFQDLSEEELKDYTITIQNGDESIVRTWNPKEKLQKFTSYDFSYETYGTFDVNIKIENKNKKRTVKNEINVKLPKGFLGFEKQNVNYSLNVKGNNKEVCTNQVKKRQNYNGDIPVFTYSLDNDLSGSIQIDTQGKVTVIDRVKMLDQIGLKGNGKIVNVNAKNEDLNLEYSYTIHFKPNNYQELLKKYHKKDCLYKINPENVTLKKWDNTQTDNNLIQDTALNNANETSGKDSLSKKNLNKFYIINKNGNVYGPFDAKLMDEEFKIEKISFGSSEKLSLYTCNGNQVNDYIFNKRNEKDQQVPLKIHLKSNYEPAKVTVYDKLTDTPLLEVDCNKDNFTKTKDGYEIVLDVSQLQETSSLVKIAVEDNQGSKDKNGNIESGNITEKEFNLIYDITSPQVSVEGIIDPDFVPSTDLDTQTEEITSFGKYSEDGKTFYASKKVQVNIKIVEKNLFKEDKIIDNAVTKWSSMDAVTNTHFLHSILNNDGKYEFAYKEDHSGNKAIYTDIQYIDVDTVKDGVVSITNVENENKFIIKVKDRNFNPSSFKLFNDTVELTQFNNLLHDLGNWEAKGEEYTFTYDNQLHKMDDGIYNLNWEYTKKNGVTLKSQTPVISMIDNTAPDVEISSIIQRQYVQDVQDLQEVMIKVNDFSGVKTIESYIKKEDGNANSVIANEDSEGNYYLDLNRDELDENGTLEFKVVDKFGNETITSKINGNKVVVDRINPKTSIEVIDEKDIYRNKDIVVNLTVEEENLDTNQIVFNNGVRDVTDLNWKKDGSKYTATYILKASKETEGEYEFTLNCTDKSGRTSNEAKSEKYVVDVTKPVVSFKDESGNQIFTPKRYYLKKNQVVILEIEDVNFDVDAIQYEIECKDLMGKDLGKKYSEEEWISKGKIHTKKFVFDQDSNVTFKVNEVKDKVGNTSDSVKDLMFTVDKTAPEKLKIQYLDGNGNEVKQKDKFFQYAVRARISATDSISPITYFEFGYKNIPGASEINQELKENIRSELKNIQEKDGKYYIEFDLPQVQNAQVNAKVNYATKDAAGNETRVEERLGDHVIVDTIDPVLNVTLSNPVQTMGGISYYSGNIMATVRVDEANFVEKNVVVLVNGVPHAVSEWSHDNDTHTAMIAINGDGDYTLEVSCKDQVGRKSIPFKSNQLTIDTQITEPVLTINGTNGNGQSYRGHVAAGISMEDKNFESYEAHLTRTRYNQHGVDVTSEFIHGISTDIHGGSGVFDTFKNIKENDGIYTLTVTMKDRAGHSATSTMTFTINRYGSVYVYDEYLSSLIQKNKNFFKKVKQDLVIDEYNPDRLVDGSMKVTVLKDGKPMKNVKYDVQSLNNGWNQYRYVISKNNFKSDGVYKIIVSSTDTSGNNPENSSGEGKEIMFFVDNTAPEISSVAGLEDKIINANKLDVKFNVFDTIGIKKIQVYVDGKEVMKVEGQQLKEDMSNYLGKFVLKESSSKQNVRIVVTDMAGNVTDTSSADFTSAYEFNSDVLVSTNFLVRFFANKPLFFGLLIVFVGLFLLKKYPKIY